ncbi:hypothetical protein PBAL39_15359 [Pedobacter sp. BAL39]|uniref:hypothetical protein n=1 Tax=Pedobacter sp. BAL39 TaxID=391596 RepID=UPI0001559CB8|nr:hypothetical protein [Pedobacter sp. BAL39]EDM37815.1 hypothetical protein PBAL39_15359 [Pedobacter sp. BAL39]
MKKLKLNLEQLGEEMELLDIEYSRGLKGGYDGGYGDGGSGGYGDYGGYDYEIYLPEVPIYGGGNYGSYSGGGTGGGGYPPIWWPTPGTGGGSGGYTGGGYTGGGYTGGGTTPSFYELAAAWMDSKYDDMADKIATSTSLANSLQTLQHAAINQLITSTGGQPITGMMESIGKTGLSKVVAVGAIYNGVKAVIAISDGNITSQDVYDAGKALLGGLSFVPGPVGLIANGISIGITLYEMSNQP